MEAGCTVHEVTPVLDDGPILGQARVPILPGDTPEERAPLWERARTQIAFYGSTPNYAYQFDDLGFSGLTPRLTEAMRAGDMAALSALVTDEVLEHVALAVLAAAQNPQEVEINFLWMDGTLPLVLLLLIAIGATVVVTESIGWAWRHRRRKRLREKDELKRLRKG